MIQTLSEEPVEVVEPNDEALPMDIILPDPEAETSDEQDAFVESDEVFIETPSQWEFAQQNAVP